MTFINQSCQTNWKTEAVKCWIVAARGGFSTMWCEGRSCHLWTDLQSAAWLQQVTVVSAAAAAAGLYIMCCCCYSSLTCTHCRLLLWLQFIKIPWISPTWAPHHGGLLPGPGIAERCVCGRHQESVSSSTAFEPIRIKGWSWVQLDCIILSDGSSSGPTLLFDALSSLFCSLLDETQLFYGWLTVDIISPSLTGSSHKTQWRQIISHTSQAVTLPYYFKSTSCTWTWWPTYFTPGPAQHIQGVRLGFFGHYDWERWLKSLCYWNTINYQSQVWMLFLSF